MAPKKQAMTAKATKPIATKGKTKENGNAKKKVRKPVDTIYSRDRATQETYAGLDEAQVRKAEEIRKSLDIENLASVSEADNEEHKSRAPIRTFRAKFFSPYCGTESERNFQPRLKSIVDGLHEVQGFLYRFSDGEVVVAFSGIDPDLELPGSVPEYTPSKSDSSKASDESDEESRKRRRGGKTKDSDDDDDDDDGQERPASKKPDRKKSKPAKQDARKTKTKQPATSSGDEQSESDSDSLESGEIREDDEPPREEEVRPALPTGGKSLPEAPQAPRKAPAGNTGHSGSTGGKKPQTARKAPRVTFENNNAPGYPTEGPRPTTAGKATPSVTVDDEGSESENEVTDRPQMDGKSLPPNLILNKNGSVKAVVADVPSDLPSSYLERFNQVPARQGGEKRPPRNEKTETKQQATDRDSRAESRAKAKAETAAQDDAESDGNTDNKKRAPKKRPADDEANSQRPSKARKGSATIDGSRKRPASRLAQNPPKAPERGARHRPAAKKKDGDDEPRPKRGPGPGKWGENTAWKELSKKALANQEKKEAERKEAEAAKKAAAEQRRAMKSQAAAESRHGTSTARKGNTLSTEEQENEAEAEGEDNEQEQEEEPVPSRRRQAARSRPVIESSSDTESSDEPPPPQKPSKRRRK